MLGLLLAMMGVTYLPRLLPMVRLGSCGVPAWVRRWLDWLPPAILGALIFPGVLTAHPAGWWLGVGAVAVAGGTALVTSNLLLIVLAAVAAVLGITVLLP